MMPDDDKPGRRKAAAADTALPSHGEIGEIAEKIADAFRRMFDDLGVSGELIEARRKLDEVVLHLHRHLAAAPVAPAPADEAE